MDHQLFVAIGPPRRLGFWLSSADDVVPEAEEAGLAALSAVAAPEVVDGPVAFALVFRIGAEAIAEAQLTLPEAWQAVVRASDTALTPDLFACRSELDCAIGQRCEHGHTVCEWP